MTDALTPALLDTLEGLAREATPGPWIQHNVVDVSAGMRRVATTRNMSADYRPLAEVAANAHYIAAFSPSVILKLIEAARRGMK